MIGTDFDKKHATSDNEGNVTAKNQNGIDAAGKPRASDKKSWEFGDSLADIKPDRNA